MWINEPPHWVFQIMLLHRSCHSLCFSHFFDPKNVQLINYSPFIQSPCTRLLSKLFCTVRLAMVFIWVRFWKQDSCLSADAPHFRTCRHKLFNCLFAIFHFWEHRSHEIWAKQLDFSLESPFLSLALPSHCHSFGRFTSSYRVQTPKYYSKSVHKILMKAHTKNFVCEYFGAFTITTSHST